MNNSPIGIYDSGAGGLSIWREVYRRLPHESLVYLGDGANCPYGSRPKEEIAKLADEAVGKLVALGCKMVIVACNTATAAAINMLRRKYSTLPIVGMEPAVKPACMQTRTGVVGVLATQSSIKGDMFRHTARKYASGVEVIAVAGEGFVELVESDSEHTPQAYEQVERIIRPILDRRADRIVLGCTHYPFLKDAIEAVCQKYEGVEIIDPSPAVARRAEELLDKFDIRADKKHTPSYEFITFADETYRKRLENKAFNEL